jgi:hypothetical protein
LSFFQGPALSWYNGLSSDLDWNTVKERFTEKYITFSWEHPSVVIENELFNNMKLNDGQEIEDFFCPTHHFFRNACTKSGSLRFSQFSGC